jgi:hypothetical protein
MATNHEVGGSSPLGVATSPNVYADSVSFALSVDFGRESRYTAGTRNEWLQFPLFSFRLVTVW